MLKIYKLVYFLKYNFNSLLPIALHNIKNILFDKV